MGYFHRYAATAVLGAALAASVASAEDGASEAEKCIPINRIDSIKVLDKQHILFEMQGKENYLNTLPNRCASLSRTKPIMYKTSISQLCSLDIITVLESYGGGYYPGASCGLGTFTPMTDDEVKTFRESLDKAD